MSDGTTYTFGPDLQPRTMVVIHPQDARYLHRVAARFGVLEVHECPHLPPGRVLVGPKDLLEGTGVLLSPIDRQRWNERWKREVTVMDLGIPAIIPLSYSLTGPCGPRGSEMAEDSSPLPAADDDLPYTAPSWLSVLVLLVVAGCMVSVFGGLAYGAAKLAARLWP